MVRTALAAASAGLFVLCLAGLAPAAQDRTGLKVPGGLAFSEFKGYEDWRPVSVSQVPDGMKLIAANEKMIAAYRSGLPAKGRLFPDGSKIVKIEWAPEPEAASPYPVNVPRRLKSVSFIEKDTKRFPRTKGWAYAQFLYDPATQSLKANGTGAECGFACHTAVSAQDYIFTAYPAR